MVGRKLREIVGCMRTAVGALENALKSPDFSSEDKAVMGAALEDQRSALAMMSCLEGNCRHREGGSEHNAPWWPVVEAEGDDAHLAADEPVG